MSDDTLRALPERRPELIYPCGDPPAAGLAREVAPGVLWLRMPMPFALDHINLYALRDGPGWAVVDTGVQTPETTSAWRTLVADEGALGDGGVSRVLVTHMHPDHVGMAGWLTRKFECRLWMTSLEYLNCRVLVRDTGREAPQEAQDFYRRAGWDEVAMDLYRTRFGGFGKFVHALPESFRRLREGDELVIGERAWTVVVGSGHSPEHACLYSRQLGVFVSGDQVLPRISSNVSVFPTEPDADPLGDWLDSLDRLRRDIPDDVLVLPAHNEPFRGLHARLDHLRSGQERSLARLVDRLATPCRAVDTFPALFARPIGQDHQQLGLATGEALAHLNYLLVRGLAKLDTDAQGVNWYRRT